MAHLAFVKMEGAGNDFVVLTRDAVGGDPLARATIERLCDRRRGIGADGVLIVDAGATGAIEIEYFNANGERAALCGNGARCAALFAAAERDLGSELMLRTGAGCLSAVVRPDGVGVEMPAPSAPPRTLPFEDVSPGLVADHLVIGVPHLILDVPSAAEAPVASLGARLRGHASLGPEGANVNFVERASDGSLRLRTYERGVEAETLACGTGAVASAWRDQGGAAYFDVEIQVRGGDRLRVTRTGKRPWLHGPARVVFRGEFPLG